MIDSLRTNPGDASPKGRVLRIKHGYNPNSSSVGSSIPLFLTISASAGVVATILINAFDALKKKRCDDVPMDEHPRPTDDDAEPND